MVIPKPNGEGNLLASLLLYKWEALNIDVFTVQTLNALGSWWKLEEAGSGTMKWVTRSTSLKSILSLFPIFLPLLSGCSELTRSTSACSDPFSMTDWNCENQSSLPFLFFIFSIFLSFFENFMGCILIIVTVHAALCSLFRCLWLRKSQ